MKSLLHFLLSLFIFSFQFASAQTKSKEFSNAPKNLKINQLQVLGTHNSYAQPVDSNVLAFADPIFKNMMGSMMKMMPADQLANYTEYHPNEVLMSEGLAYDHPPLKDQLDAGLRSLEIDVYYDPTGNRFNDPAAYRAMRAQGVTNLAPFKTAGLEKPGFKVLHVADFDFRTHCNTLKACLTELKEWSDAHPNHIPIFILLEVKDQRIPIFPNPSEVLSFDSTAFAALDKEVLDVLGRKKIITPDDVRGKYETLEKAVLANNWTTLEKARGKFVFLMLPAINEAAMKPYFAGRPSLEGRVMFVRSTPGSPHSAFLLLDNSIVRKKDIQKYVQQGYLVRTRSDIETYEAKVNDYTRANAAFESGAQVISTDFFRAGNKYKTNYIVKLPGGSVARCNPVNASKICKQ